MSHRLTSSIDSTSSSLSTLSTASSFASLSEVISVRDEGYKGKVKVLEEQPIPLEELIVSATSLIDILAANDEKNIYDYNGSKLKLHDVLRAMMHHADGCGGQDGKRYTASAICTCSIKDDPDNEKTLEMLRDLARTWVSHLLFVFRVDASHSSQKNKTPSGIATTSLESTASLMDPGVSSTDRSAAFKEQLLERDGYRCIATGRLDIAHPNAQGAQVFRLVGCHIIRRAISIYDSQKDQDAYGSAVASFAILRNYGSLSEKDIQALGDNVDDPSNGFLLRSDAHTGFDHFDWCLQMTEVPNEYKIKIYGPAHGIDDMGMGDSKVVTFKDHSEELQMNAGKSFRKRKFGVSLPNPHYIRIHAAVAGIMHMSGAGKFFDELLGKFGDQDGSSVVRSWEEFERVVETANLRKGLSFLAVH